MTNCDWIKLDTCLTTGLWVLDKENTKTSHYQLIVVICIQCFLINSDTLYIILFKQMCMFRKILFREELNPISTSVGDITAMENRRTFVIMT